MDEREEVEWEFYVRMTRAEIRKLIDTIEWPEELLVALDNAQSKDEPADILIQVRG